MKLQIKCLKKIFSSLMMLGIALGLCAYAMALIGDLDGNGSVDDADRAILSDNWLSNNAMPSQGDLDGDGDVDLNDLSKLASHWGDTETGNSDSLPDSDDGDPREGDIPSDDDGSNSMGDDYGSGTTDDDSDDSAYNDNDNQDEKNSPGDSSSVAFNARKYRFL